MKHFLASGLLCCALSASAQTDTCILSGPNQIVNGDFEQGYYGFSSDFGRGVNNATLGGCATQGWILVAQIFPHVNPNCQVYPPAWSALYGGPNTLTSSDPNHPSNTSVVTTATCNYPLPDHSTGSGFFLTIDPDAVTGRAYWKQSIEVCPNTNYVFSVWVRNISGIPAPYFHFEVDGVNINAPTQYPAGEWVKTAAKWNSGNLDGSVQIRLVNDQPGCIENDVAIDDLFFGICGGAYLTCDTLFRFCSDAAPDSIVLSGAAIGFSAPQYQWQKRAPNGLWQNIPGATTDTWIIQQPNAGSNGQYRLLAASAGNLGSANCEVLSETLRVEILPVYDTQIQVNICPGAAYMGYSTSGVYTDFFQTTAGCDSVRTLHLDMRPVFKTEETRDICAGETYAGHSASGVYTDTLATVFGCDSVRTLRLEVRPVHETRLNQTLCPGGSILFNNRWLGASGIYRDTLANVYGCDSVILLDLVVLPGDFLGNDTVLCSAGAFTLRSPSENTLWFDQSVGREKTVTETGLYWARYTDDNGCPVVDSIMVYFPLQIYFPNAFSPDDDGRNDVFLPGLSGEGWLSFRMEIFDRWGNLLFTSDDPARGWDGTFRGKACEPGVYVYVASIGTAACGMVRREGDVSLWR